MDPEKKILDEDKKRGLQFVFTLEPSSMPMERFHQCTVIVDDRLMPTFREGKKKYLELIVARLLEQIDKAAAERAPGSHDGN